MSATRQILISQVILVKFNRIHLIPIQIYKLAQPLADKQKSQPCAISSKNELDPLSEIGGNVIPIQAALLGIHSPITSSFGKLQ